MASACKHLNGLAATDFPPLTMPPACAECLVENTLWVALRECRQCGHVGRCDSSPGKHATRHFHTTHHPVMRAVPPENWTWCYVHEAMGQLCEPAPDPASRKH